MGGSIGCGVPEWKKCRSGKRGKTGVLFFFSKKKGGVADDEYTVQGQTKVQVVHVKMVGGWSGNCSRHTWRAQGGKRLFLFIYFFQKMTVKTGKVVGVCSTTG